MTAPALKGKYDLLQAEIEDLRSKLNETEQVLDAIRNGEVDAIVVSGNKGERIFSLSTSETPYRIIIESMDEGAVTVSSKGIILYCNNRFSEILSIPYGRLTGSDFNDLLPDPDRVVFRRLLKLGLKKPVRGEVRTRSDGRECYMRLSFTPLPDNIEGDVCIVVSDITEIKKYQNYLKETVEERTKKLREANQLLQNDIKTIRKAEKDLQLSEEKYQLAVSAAGIGTWERVFRLNRWKLSWSDRMFDIFGLPPNSSMTHGKWFSMVHPDDRKRVTGEIKFIIEKHADYDSEYRIILSDGSVHWVHCTGKITHADKSGGVRINGITRDVTKRKSAESDLKESEEKYRLLSDSMMQGVIYRDSDGRIISINPAGERILGKDSGEILGKKIAAELLGEDGKPLPAQDYPSLQSLRTGLRYTGQIFRIHNSRDNTFRWVSIDTMPLYRAGSTKPYQVYSVFTDITQQKNAEKEILQREQLFRSAFDEGAVPMTITSKEGVFLRVNRAFCILTGYDEQELKGMTFQEMTHPDDLDKSILGRDEMKRGDKTSFKTEKRYIRKDGKAVWVAISTAPVMDEHGQWDFFVTHVQDINKRKNAENRLKESKERFKQLANSIPQLAWIARADGFAFWFNHRWYEYTGTSPEEVTGWGWQKVYEQQGAKDILNFWKQSIAKGLPFEMVLPVRGKDGLYREFLAKSIPIKDRDGNVEQWFGTYTDVSELKKVEKELKDSREKLNIALENGQIGTWEWDIRTNRVVWDERAEKMFGLEPGKFEGTLEAFENYIHEEDLPHVRRAIKESLEEGKPFEAVYRTRPVNGLSNYITTKALLTTDHDGKPSTMSGVLFDVTGMKMGAEHTLIRLNEELLRSNTDLQQFAYVASHDLQEPLRMVSSFTQLLQQRYQEKLDADGNEFIRYAVEGSKRMYELLNGLLAFSRVQTRGREFDLVDMRQVIEKVKQNLSLAIRETNAVIRTGRLPLILADESQMIQLVQNLIENSIKFRKGDPDITISCRSDEEFHVFSIKDRGIGIESQYFERIFKIFQRLHRSDEYEGTGIGLAICKRIVEHHSGKIWLESKPGKGSTFFFSIPAGSGANDF